MVRFALLCLFLAVAAPAQVQFGAGFKGAIAAPGWYQSQSGRDEAADKSSGFTGGPFVEIRLLERFGIEAGALYRSIGRQASTVFPGLSSSSESETGSIWQVPVLAKYRFGQVRRFRPFIAAGPAFFRLRADVNSSGEYLGSVDGEPAIIRWTKSEKLKDSGLGFAAGAGIERRAGPARFTLEGRFTAWPGNDWDCGLACRETRQFDVMFGVGF